MDAQRSAVERVGAVITAGETGEVVPLSREARR
jgi:hypothetical protein